MPEHAAIEAVTTIRSPTTMGADGRDKDNDNRVVVDHLAMVLGDKADFFPMVATNVATRVTVGRSVLSIPIRDHHYPLGVLIARGGLHSYRVHRDRLSPTSSVSPFLYPSSSTSTSTAPRCLIIKVIGQDIRHHLGVRASIRPQV